MCRRICTPIQICNFDIRNDANNRTTDLCNFLEDNFRTLSDRSFLKDFLTRRKCLSEAFFRQSVSAPLEQERMIVLVVPQLQESPLEHLSLCFPLITFSHSPFHALD